LSLYQWKQFKTYLFNITKRCRLYPSVYMQLPVLELSENNEFQSMRKVAFLPNWKVYLGIFQQETNKHQNNYSQNSGSSDL